MIKIISWQSRFFRTITMQLVMKVQSKTVMKICKSGKHYDPVWPWPWSPYNIKIENWRRNHCTQQRSWKINFTLNARHPFQLPVLDKLFQVLPSESQAIIENVLADAKSFPSCLMKLTFHLNPILLMTSLLILVHIPFFLVYSFFLPLPRSSCFLFLFCLPFIFFFNL